MVQSFVWRDVSGTVGGGGSNGRWTVVSSDSNLIVMLQVLNLAMLVDLRVKL